MTMNLKFRRTPALNELFVCSGSTISSTSNTSECLLLADAISNHYEFNTYKIVPVSFVRCYH